MGDSGRLESVLIVSGCGGGTRRYRCDHKREQLRLHGVKSIVADYGEDWVLGDISLFDFLILHRVPIDDCVDSLIRKARALGRPVVFDTDDLVFEPEALPWIRVLGKLSKEEADLYVDGVHRYRATLEMCDFVFASTDYLAEQARRIGRRALVVRNALSFDMLRLSEQARDARRANGNRVVLGYFSGTKTHDRDFQEASSAICSVLSDCPHVELTLVGPLEVDGRFSIFGDRVQRLSLVSWQQLPRLIAQVDINLAPLELGNPFCESKSEIKYVEAGILGVPTVASTTDAFAFAVKHGENGLLAHTARDWEACIRLLVEDRGLRERIGVNALRHVQDYYSPETRSEELMTALQVAHESLPCAAPVPKKQVRKRLVVNWALGEPIKGSGGYSDIFHAVRELSRLGHENHIYVRPEETFIGAKPTDVAAFVKRHFFDIEAEIHIGHDFGDGDVLIATHWTTAEAVSQASGRAKKFYFVQDFEPWFYSAGVEYMSAERTYAFPLTCMTLGPWLARFLRERYGARTVCFDFAHDKDVYFPVDGQRSQRPRIAFYARPSTPRRATSLGFAALEIVHQVAPEVEIVLFGANDLDQEQVTFPFVSAGILPPPRLADLYRSSTLGLTISCTNPSLVPFEMLACKCPVVEIRSERVSDLLVDGSTALLAEPTPNDLANAMLTLLDNAALREAIAQRGYELVKDWCWENSAKQIEQALLAEIEGASGIGCKGQMTKSSTVAVSQAVTLHRCLDVSQPNAHSIIGEISGSRSAGQSFICREDGLYRIEVRAATYGGRARGRIVYHLKEHPQATDSLVTLEHDAADVPEDGWLTFCFAPILGSRLKAYYFSVEMPDSKPSRGLTLYYSTTRFIDGTRYENHVPVVGSLTFRTYAMYGRSFLSGPERPLHTEIISLIKRQQEELALARVRLARVESESASLMQFLASADQRAPGRQSRSWCPELVEKSWVTLRQRGVGGLAREAGRFVRWRFSNREPVYKRYQRGSGANVIAKSWLVLRHEGISGFRQEVRRYARWRVLRSKSPPMDYLPEGDTNLLAKSWLVLRHEGLGGFRREVRNSVLWRLSHW